MASSLPNLCLRKIFECIEEDKISLHSCLLVNWHWCQEVVPILWRSPNAYMSKQLVEVYIACLSDEEKQILNDNGLNLPPSTESPPTFDYAKYRRVLHLGGLYHHLWWWCNLRRDECIGAEGRFILTELLLKLFVSRCPAIYRFSCDATWLLEKYDITSYPGAESCLQHIRRLTLTGKRLRKYFENFSICHGVCQLKTYLPVYEWDNEKQCRNTEKFEVEVEGLVTFIQAQRNLQDLELHGDYYGHDTGGRIIAALQSQSETLTRLKLSYVRFEGQPPFFGIGACKNLEILEFDGCDGLTTEMCSPMVESPLSKLSQLNISNSDIPVDIVSSLAYNANTSLREVTLCSTQSTKYLVQVINALVKNCPNLTKFESNQIHGIEEVSAICSLLSSSQQLENLAIYGASLDAETFLPAIGQSIPDSLRRLNISSEWSFTTTAFESFLKNCKAPLTWLTLSGCECITDEYLELVVQYLGKTLQYLGVYRAVYNRMESFDKVREVIPEVDAPVESHLKFYQRKCQRDD
ncbi:25039_t:CDS:1 [Cetraspora pellucida]|uniref:25039_t:CDS:1 n=1 Tax=Cetraspora pellucida TaxID=1433469 RepID=A0A9N9C7Y6_9GLOM|nr:25039_t:CDS:1 [Cetraspora pellucida]